VSSLATTIWNTRAKGYHNIEWAKKMVYIGLIPSYTGAEGGKMIGTKMSDYIDNKGLLRGLIDQLPNDYWLPFETSDILSFQQLQGMLELEEDPNKVEEIKEQISEIDKAQKKLKVKYTCSNCGVNIWGKPLLNIMCGDCNVQFL
jgi:hypothetical protein